MRKEVSVDSCTIKKQTSGEQAWHAFLSILLQAKDRSRLRIPETLFFGWGMKKPTVLFTDEDGFLKTGKEISTSFITNFLSFCPKEDFLPICVGRQTSTFPIMDSKAAITLWHKNLVVHRSIVIQRYIAHKGQFSALTKIIWKPDSMQFVTLTNIIPYTGYLKRRSLLTLGKSIASLEDRFFTRSDQAGMSADISNSEELEKLVVVLSLLYKRVLNDQHQYLSEMVAEFVQEKQGRWYLLRVPSFEVTKVPQSSVPVLTPMRIKQRDRTWNSESRYKYLSIKRMSQTILSIKQSLGLAITMEDRERLASYTDFSKKLKTKQPLPQLPSKKSKEEVKVTPPPAYIETEGATSMPPLFQFPTPRDSEDHDTPKLEDIKAYIHRQNNSLYMRIHYQEPLSDDSQALQSVSFVAEEFDRIREQGVEGRDVLRTRNFGMYRANSVV